MSNLLEFHHTIVTDGKAIYDIQKSKLNPTDLELTDVQESVESFDKYSLTVLREYILRNSELLTASGDVIRGEVKQGKVELTILKVEQDETT